MERLQTEIHTLSSQVESIMDIERRVVRLSKEFDLNSIYKMIQAVFIYFNQKANHTETN